MANTMTWMMNTMTVEAIGSTAWFLSSTVVKPGMSTVEIKGGRGTIRFDRSSTRGWIDMILWGECWNSGARRILKETRRNVEGVVKVLNRFEGLREAASCTSDVRIADGNHVVQDESREVRRHPLTSRNTNVSVAPRYQMSYEVTAIDYRIDPMLLEKRILEKSDVRALEII